VRTIAGTACAGYLLVRYLSGTAAAVSPRAERPRAAQIEPLVAADGSGTVLLNRGWVPAAWRVRCCARALCALR